MVSERALLVYRRALHILYITFNMFVYGIPHLVVDAQLLN